MRHLIKSLFMTLVVTAGAVLAMLILLNHSFFDARVNTLTFWCIVVLLACIWGAFIGEVRETTSQQKPQKPADSDAMEKLVDAAALNEAAPEEEAPFEEAAPKAAAAAEAAPAAPAEAPAANEEAVPAAPAPEELVKNSILVDL